MPVRQREEVQEMSRSPGIVRFLIAGLVTVVGACGGEVPPRTETPPPVPTETLSDQAVVDVSLLEYIIGSPEVLPAGTVELRLSNQGFEPHNLKLVDPRNGEVLWETEDDLPSGEVRSVELTLEPGAYTLVCDVAGHDSRGMVRDVSVVAAPVTEDG